MSKITLKEAIENVCRTRFCMEDIEMTFEDELSILELFEQIAEERKSDPNSAFYVNEQ